MESIRIFTLRKANSALHEELVDVHRGGKVFKRRQKKKDAEAETGKKVSMLDAPGLPKPPKDSVAAEKQKEADKDEAAADQKVIDAYIAKAPPGTKDRLNAIGSQLKAAIKGLAKPGDRSSIKIGGKDIPLVRGKGSMLSIGGMWTSSMRGAALMVHGLEQTASSGGMLMSGVMQAGVAQSGAAREAVQRTHAAAEQLRGKAAAELARAKAVAKRA